MGHYHSVVKDIQGPTRELRGMIPEVYEGFAQIHRAAYSDGALSGGTKELIAIAIAIAEGCEGCIASHARAAVSYTHLTLPTIHPRYIWVCPVSFR